MDKKVKTARTAETPSQDAKHKPIDTVRIGDVSGSIWGRDVTVQGQPRTFYSASFERQYRTRDGGFGYSKSFDADTFGTLIAVIEKTDEYIKRLLKAQDAQ